MRKEKPPQITWSGLKRKARKTFTFFGPTAYKE